eukprot:TRINITY_DN6158_c0_g1_i2.p1 TRINITY_DN6158_c0_g1~~TRINITY_DN6158_c0_g1_i2.p1  ORF type:complete len:132 (+),score=37.94 TRINITY_DN6158_c0_g1_i2:384-779(+)
MLRRTTLYQELLALMQRAHNPHHYGSELALTYRLGYFKHDDDSAVPTIIPLEHEQEGRLVLEYLEAQEARIKDGIDLIVVPATQVAPSGLCTPVPEAAAAAAQKQCSSREGAQAAVAGTRASYSVADTVVG